ncbi:TlpA family protein disulfide reductase [Aureibacillus halotolerans]|uniref:Peroxiredoxin n=1 Tax=Aureibacillus halotolerans TaxID=1508390 RepID=A0A4R6TXS9_9BACI|nr:redoxin domain-containing protein [Aureibacillus halotolerans]TDQ34613.1 peroxiredoxin [Aureibacillus halotolerans]
MNKNRLISWILVIGLIVAATSVAVEMFSEDTLLAKAGEQAPLFTLKNLDGEVTTLEDFKGQGVLLNFWASWCVPCVNELPLLNEADKLMDGVTVVAVNLGEDKETAQTFVDRYDLRFPILLDQEHSLRTTYQITSQPVSLLIDPSGTIVERRIGAIDPFEEIMRMMKSVQPDSL